MRRIPWFMVLLIALQLCMGSAWASPEEFEPSTLPGSHADGTVKAHCHDDDSSAPVSAHTCCSAAHCHLCSVAGIALQSFSTIALPDTPHVGISGTMLLSKVHPPEIRPPI